MASPVQSITGQVESIYDKAISEIEQEEREIENQIRRFVDQKAAVNKKHEDIHQLLAQVENLTEVIRDVEEHYKAELEEKAKLDAQIQQLTGTLNRLQADARSTETKLYKTKNERRAKYQLLAEVIEMFGDKVTVKLPGEVVVNLERKIRDTEDTQLEA